MTAEEGKRPMQVSADTRISDVLARYGDIAEVMETLGVKRVARFDIRKLLGKAITVKRAAFVHHLSTEDMIKTLQTAIDQVHQRAE